LANNLGFRSVKYAGSEEMTKIFGNMTIFENQNLVGYLLNFVGLGILQVIFVSTFLPELAVLPMLSLI
jgi:hypothetical protein